jgi:lysozyme
VKGVDVSHFQGDIDWGVLSGQDIDFAFIKATEGSGGIDECFFKNWEDVQKTDLAAGAYHFFSFDSNAAAQAANYMATVNVLDGGLPPAIDFEFYGDKEAYPPDAAQTRRSLQELLDILENHYGKKPIIYATMKTYNIYLKGEFDAYPLWIRNVYYTPQWDLKGKWTFWQYSDRGVLPGYSGDEKYIDLNVFYGNKSELEDLMQ